MTAPLGRQFTAQLPPDPSPDYEEPDAKVRRRPSNKTNSGYQSPKNSMADWRFERARAASGAKPVWRRQGNSE